MPDVAARRRLFRKGRRIRPIVKEISLVDRPANMAPFLMYKRADKLAGALLESLRSLVNVAGSPEYKDMNGVVAILQKFSGLREEK